jgi:predicted nucleic acid-binding protein
MNFFDTSVLVASLIPHHVDHARSLACIQGLRRNGGACGSHTLAEAFNTLTKKSAYGLSPASVSQLLAQVDRDFTLVSLTPQDTLLAIDSASQRNLSGGIIFDCLLIACARKVNATNIYTSNVRHFRQIAPDLASRIQAP